MNIKNPAIPRDAIDRAHRNNCMILPNGRLYSMNDFETRLNNNVIIMGASGACKTRGAVIPNLLSANGSYIVTDTKGNLYKKYGGYLKAQGYKVRHLNLIHPDRSDHYNPLRYVHTSDDILKLAHQIIYAGGGAKGGSYDPFWDRTAEMLLAALIGYLIEGGSGAPCSLTGVVQLLGKIETDDDFFERARNKCEMDKLFNTHNTNYLSRCNEESWAYEQYDKFRTAPPKTYCTILITLQAVLGGMDTREIRRLMEKDEMDFASVGEEKTAIFVEISDTDRSKDFLANLFYSQAMNELCTYADERCEDSRLPVPVRFILDDFGTNCRIEGFENMISNIRSRGISAMMILQSESQLTRGYGDSAHTIMDNCDTFVYMGGNDVCTAELISKRSNRSVMQIMNMPLNTNWLFRRGEPPLESRTVDLSEYTIPRVSETVEIITA